MPQLASAQIKLRRAFRYGYYAFVASIVLALVLLAIRSLSGNAMALLGFPLADASLWPMMGILVLGLCVPLFFACWLLVGTAVLGRSPQLRTFTDRIAD